MNLRRNILLWCIAVALASRLIPTVVAADTDGDGLPDDWELQYGFPAGNLADNLPPGLTTYHARFIRPITLANQSGKAWANAEVRLVVDTAGLILDGKMAVDGRDLRFAAIAGVSDSPDKMLDFWIESGMNTPATVIWIRASQLVEGNATVYMMYGNANAISTSNGSKVFRLYDDFEGNNLDPVKWGGDAPLSGGVWSGGLRSMAEFDQVEGVVLEYRMYKLAEPTQYAPPDYWFAGFADGAGDTSGAYFHWYNHKPAGTTVVAITSDKGNTGWLNTGIQLDGAWNKYAQYYSSTRNILSINDGAWSHTLNGSASGSENVCFGVTATGTRDFLFDWVRVRAWVDPPPASSVGGELVSPYNSADDADGDGLTNLREFQIGSNPLVTDTDGDGLPDGWEDANGLSAANPLDATSRPLGDRLTFAQKFLFELDPTKTDTDSDGVSDFDELFVFGTDPKLNPNVSGLKRNQFYYDRNDRLIGADYANGLTLAYTYDGNGNLVRQNSLSRASSMNGLPVSWKFLNGLSTTNGAGSGAFDDPDGDGWSNYQEWRAGSSPTNSASLPDVYGLPGINLGSFPWPFTPTNFVVATGQLDGVGADEIVVSADGDATGKTNFVLILSQTTTGWVSTNVFVGEFGVTSLAIGQPTNREVPAIYAGLRSATSTGGVMEVRRYGGVWQPNIIARSTNAYAQVLGVRTERDVLVSLATNVTDGALFGLGFANAWKIQTLDTNVSHRGLGTLADPASTNQVTLRLLDSGGIRSFSYAAPVSLLQLPSGNVQRPGSDSRYFLTPTAMSWSNAQAYARSFGGNLVTIEDDTENSWIVGQIGSTNVWIGLHRDPLYWYPNADWTNMSKWRWISGSSSSYRKFPSGQPNNGDNETQFFLRIDDIGGSRTWNDVKNEEPTTFGLVEVAPSGLLEDLVISEPVATKTNNWLGHNLDAGFPRQNVTNAYSVFYAFNDDKNGNGVGDEGDDFVLAEYLVNGTNWIRTTLSRQSAPASVANPAYGLAAINYLGSSTEVLFTGEPDGSVFSWIAMSATNPLQRQLFSSHYAGKAWHALSGVKTLEPGEGLVGLRVSTNAPNTCDVIFWPPQPELWQPVVVPQTAPLAAIVTPPSSGSGIAYVNVKLWDAEGSPALPELQYSTNNGATWTTAAIVALNSGMLARVAAPPTGAVHQLTWNAGSDFGAGFSGTPKLRVRASDVSAAGNWSLAVDYTLNISPGNPIATNDFFTVAEDTIGIFEVLTNDSVQPPHTLVIESVSTPAHGTAVIKTPTTIEYIPATNYFGPDAFTYTVSDGAGGTSMALVSVTVTPVNDPPVATNLTFHGQEDRTVQLGWGTARDDERDTVTLIAVSPASSQGGVVILSGDTITYLPPTDFNGTDTFTYTVRDNGKTGVMDDFKTATGTVTIHLAAVNDPPVITLPAPQAVNEDASLSLPNLTIADVDAGTAPIRVSFTMTNGFLTLAATNELVFSSGTDGGSAFTFTGTLANISNALANVIFRGTSNFFGAGAVRIEVDDQGNTGAGGALTNIQVVMITINPVNDAPLITLLSPTNNAQFVAIDIIHLEAGAIDVEGQVITVEFFEGTNRLATLNGPPYTFAWSNQPWLSAPTNYAIYAKGTDASGKEGFSGTNLINVRPPGLFKIVSPEMQAARFALVITGETGQKYSIETSTNLETWAPLTTVTNSTGTLSVEDELTGGVDRKFYRARLVR